MRSKVVFIRASPPTFDEFVVPSLGIGPAGYFPTGIGQNPAGFFSISLLETAPAAEEKFVIVSKYC